MMLVKKLYIITVWGSDLYKQPSMTANCTIYIDTSLQCVYASCIGEYIQEHG